MAPSDAPKLDATDLRILDLLQRNARTSNAEIARELDMAPSAILERIRKLETRGVIAGYEARLSPKAVGLGLAAFVFVRAEETGTGTETGKLLAQIPEVQEVHQVAGEDCYLLRLRARDTDDLARLLNERLKSIRTIRGTRTTIVLGTLKETARLALGESVGEPAPAAARSAGKRAR
ncbi:MAG: Lrp/AsnC family transcriptional regulator [Planctomycetota bacterium]|nr:MAG: Lrp/AsnC family transcriptional regulator [Planctomycetota bacterium]